MKIEIEKNVPIPQRGKRGALFEKINTLEVGDSLFVEDMTPSAFGYLRSKLHGGTTKQFTTRKADKDGAKGLRIWRLV